MNNFWKESVLNQSLGTEVAFWIQPLDEDQDRQYAFEQNEAERHGPPFSIAGCLWND